MARVFAYCRVSTSGQTTDNQIQEIQAAGYTIEPKRIICETVSGSTALAQRKGFQKMLDRLEAGDILVVSKMDRLGRNAIDVMQTVELVAEMGVKLICLALGNTDLTSSAGKMTMRIIVAMAQFEKDLLVERTHAGLERAKSQGIKLGRKAKLDEKRKIVVRAELAAGASVSAVAGRYKLSRATIMRARDEALEAA